jgi:hypothetical protein
VFSLQTFAKNIFGILQTIKIREEGGNRQQPAEAAAAANVPASQSAVSILLHVLFVNN